MRYFYLLLFLLIAQRTYSNPFTNLTSPQFRYLLNEEDPFKENSESIYNWIRFSTIPDLEQFDPQCWNWLKPSTAWTDRFRKLAEPCLENRPSDLELVSVYKSLSVYGPLSDSQFIRATEWTLNGRKVHALIAIKDNQPRPLMILRGGVFAQLGLLAAEKMFLVAFFEQSPFNVMILESTSGEPYLMRNPKDISFGGVEEALQTLDLIQKLNSPEEPLNKLISEIHLGGLSMGGLGMHLVSHWPLPKGLPIKSTTLYCPLTDFAGSVAAQKSNFVQAVLVNLWSVVRLFQVIQREGVPWLNSFQHLIDRASAVPATQAPPEYQGFTQAHQRIAQLDPRQAKVPVIAMNSIHDNIVPFELNSGLWPLTHQVTLSKGHHCSFLGAYPWEHMAIAITSFAVSNSSLSDHRQWPPWTTIEQSNKRYDKYILQRWKATEAMRTKQGEP